MHDARRQFCRHLLLVAILLTAARSPVWALHRESPAVIPVTTSGSHAISPGRSWDRNLAFSTTEDLLGNGSTGRQIFIFSLSDFDCEAGLTHDQTICPTPPWHPIRQVTTGIGDADNPSVATLSVTVPTSDGGVASLLRPAWVAFDANGSYGGGVGCSLACQQHRQIFMANVVTNEVLRVTSSTDGDNVRPSLSSGGALVIFESTAALPNHKGPAGVRQIWIYERDSQFLRQITAGQAPSLSPSLSRDGGRLGFESTADLTGDGHDTGIMQVFGGTYDRSAHQSTIVKLTGGSANSQRPYLGEQSPVVYFDSDAGDLPGGDAGPGTRVFSVPTDQGATPSVTQYTTVAKEGNCTFPGMDPFMNHLSFICTGDPLGNGTKGNRVFTLDVPNNVLAQMTGLGDVQGPIATNLGNFFIAFTTTEDLAGTGSCGRQIAVLDFFMTFPNNTASVAKWIGATQPGQLPPDVLPPNQTQSSTIGKREFTWQPGSGNNGSQESITTRDGTSTTPIVGNGRFLFNVSAPDPFSGVASVNVPAAGTSFPPLPIGGFGALCVTQKADGDGSISCNGGGPGGDLLVRQDHNTDSSDPVCLLGCREGAPCQGGLPGPHQLPCPKCVAGLCNSGFNVGASCATDLDCQPLSPGKCVGGFCTNSASDGKSCTVSQQCTALTQCKKGLLGVCNGPIQVVPTGTYAPGGMKATLPLTMKLSTDAGVDGVFCTPDDVYPVTDIPATLHLTTGNVTANVGDADDHVGTQLLASLNGAPFDCSALRNRRMDGALLAGVLLQLDLPDVPGLRDVILGLRLAPSATEVGSCSCDIDADCNDGNPCNGTGQCVNHSCVRSPMNCDDGNACTEDSCDPILGCQHVTLADGTGCDDSNPCNGHETCHAGQCKPGTPLPDNTSCDDGNACNGAEKCSAGVCAPGTPLADGTSCTDGNACNGPESCKSQVCVPTAPLDCNDQNPCTVDTCSKVTGCKHAPLLDGTPCGSGDVCTGAPTCKTGVCQPGSTLPDGASCFDGNACNGTETCKAGTCSAASGPVNCNDQNPCTQDTCDPVLGCLNQPVPDGTACSPAPGGNGNGECRSGICKSPKSSICDDKNACTVDSVDSNGGCVHVPAADGTPCGKANQVQNLCRGVDSCRAGICTAGSAPSCDDGNRCTIDKCDPGLGCTHTAVQALPGVLCQLKSLHDDLKKAPKRLFRGRRLQKHLITLAAQARSTMSAAMVLDGKAHRLALRKASRSLDRLVSMLKVGGATHRIDGTVAANFLSSATGAQKLLADNLP